MIAQISGPAAAIDALPGEADAVPRALKAAGAEAGEALHPLLEAGLAAAHEPAFRISTEGIDAAVKVLGDRSGAVLLVEETRWTHTLVGMSFEEVPLALAAAVDLGPRPISDEPPVRLGPPAMAELIGRTQAHGHGLPRADAEALQRRLEPGVRHWSVRRARPDGLGGELRRNVEVVEGDAGIWRVRTVDDGLVELAPTTSTAVLRELVALLDEARAPG